MIDPNEPRSPRRRRWPWIVLVIIIAIPAILIIFLKVAIKTNPIRPGQLRPPTELVSLKLDAARMAAIPNPGAPGPIDTFPTNSPNQSAAAIYNKYAGKIKGPFDWPLPDWPFLKWEFNDPLTTEQVQFLIASREMIADFMKIAAADKTPMLSDDQACGFTVSQLLRMEHRDQFLLRRVSVLLAAECRRLRDQGDFNGAADTLLAIHSIAFMFREPAEVEFWTALTMQYDADCILAHWLSEGTIKPDVAVILSNRLAITAIERDQYRRFLEIAYCHSRNELIQTLNSRFGNLMSYAILPELMDTTKKPHEDGTTPQKLAFVFGMLFKGAGRAYLMKINAPNEIDRFDAQFKIALQAFDADQPIPPDLKIKFFRTFDEPHLQARIKTNTALLRTELAALNEIAGTPGEQIDPFRNQPMSRIEETTTTLIYSIGPDSKDQRAELKYDPTNGTLSTGDIFIRIPNPRERRSPDRQNNRETQRDSDRNSVTEIQNAPEVRPRVAPGEAKRRRG